jgi:hypothetical protein
MKKYGKTLIPVVLLLAVATLTLWPLVKPVFARTIGEVGMRLGQYTGPIAGTAQDDNVKASLDIVHDYRRKAVKKAQTSVKSTTPNLFDVSGGAIIITDFYGLVTTQLGATPTTLVIQLDADTGFVDYDFSTTVAVTSQSAGDRIVFSAANESVLTPLNATSGGATSLFKSWFCGEGMIEATASTADNDGAITWYMEYYVLDSGTTVTAQ